MCFRVHTQHMKSHIKHMQLSYAQYIKKIIMFIFSGVLDPIYKIKNQIKIIINGDYSHKCQVKIQDITSLPSQNNTVPGILGTHNKIMKKGGVIISHGCFILPSSLIGLKLLPLHLQLEYSALPEMHLPLVQYINRLRGKHPLRFHLL